MRLRIALILGWLLPLALLMPAQAAEQGEADVPRSISGSVIASTGPVKGAVVRAVSEGREAFARTDAQGHFVFRNMTGRGWTLTTSRGAESAEGSAWVQHRDAEDVVLELGVTRKVRGLIRDETGVPLGNARVRAGRYVAAQMVDFVDIQTGADGLFEVPVKGFSPIGVMVQAHGYLPRFFDNAASSEPLDVVLERSETLRGVVVDSAGAPVAKAVLGLKRYEQAGFDTSCLGLPPMTVLTGEDGTFAVEGLPQGRYTFAIQPKAHLGRRGEIQVPTEPVRWVLPAGHDVTVTLPNRPPRPTRVLVQGPKGAVSDEQFSIHQVAAVDSDGKARLTNLLPGEYDVEARLDDKAGSSRRLQQVHSISGGSRGFEMDLWGPHSLEGVVVEREERPMDDVTVVARKDEGGSKFWAQVTPSQGAFSFAGLPAGMLVLEAWSNTRVLASMKVQVPNDVSIRFEVSRPTRGRINGRVLDDKGRPVQSFRLDSMLLKSSDGRFDVAVDSADGQVWAYVGAEGFAGTLVKLVSSPKGSSNPKDIRLGMGRALTGRVVTADGRGVAGARLRCEWAPPSPPGAWAACSGQTRPDGSFSLPHVPTQPLVIEVSHPKQLDVRQLVPEGRTRVQVRFAQGLTLKGRIRDATGRFLEAGTVHVRLDGVERLYVGEVDSEGRYELRVPPGRGTIEALYRDGELGRFKGKDGETIRVDMVVRSGS